MAQPLEDVYCTLLMSDSYLPGAAVLSHSLRDAGTTKKLAVLATLETLSADTITQLRALYDYVIPVERIRSPNLANLYLMGRPDLSYAFTKIALWRQTRFRKIVYLDADVVALRALDELFDIEAPFAAAPDIGWPDAFNSGVMVLTPDMGQYWALHTLAASGDSFDGADQGLLNQYYENRPWQRLKFTYNTTPNAEYQWEPAYQYYKKDINAVHFIGKTKPWSNQHAGRSSGSGVYKELLAHWWAVHDKHAQDDSTAQSQHSKLPTVLPAEPLLTDSSEQAKDADQSTVEPTPTAELREFSAPNIEWDATRFEPPVQSRPEAANFPTQTYTFSDSRELFKAPGSYPEAPKDMWYKVPGSKPQPAEVLKPIFPWEQQPNRAKATRVFAEDLPPEPTPDFIAPSPTHAFSTVHYKDDEGTAARETIPDHSSAQGAIDESWQSFQQHNANAWDNVPGIDNYVRAIMDSQTKKGKTQVLQQVTGTQDIGSPVEERRNRRESLILTDFPSAIERPSLPVTPAPQKRPTFWGEERNGPGGLPVATGVPDQTEWNPEEKLDQLRRSSVVEFEHLKNDEHPNPPLRTLPEESAHVDSTADSKNVSQSAPTGEQSGIFKSGFTMSDFGTDFGRRQTDPTSPTEIRDFASQENAKHDFPKLAVPGVNLDSPIQTTSTEKIDVPTTSTSSSSIIRADFPIGDEAIVRSTEKAEQADPNNKNVSADKGEVAHQDVTKSGKIVEKDVTNRNVPKTEIASKDLVGENVPESNVGLKRDVTGETPPVPQPGPTQQAYIDDGSSAQPHSAQHDSPGTEGKRDTLSARGNTDPLSPPPKATGKQDEPAGLFSTIASVIPTLALTESSKPQLVSTAPSTSAPDQTSTLSSFVKAGQNLVGRGTSEPQRGISSDSGLERSSPKQESTLSGLIQTGKELVGLGTSTPDHKPYGDLSSTSDNSISHVPTLRHGSTIRSYDSSADKITGDSLQGQYSSHYDSSRGSGLFGQSTSHRFPSGSSSFSSSEQPSQQPTSLGRDFKYSDSVGTGGEKSGFYSSQSSSSHPYGSSSYSSQLDRLYEPPNTSGPPTSERFYSTSTERYSSLSGRPSSSSLYGTATSSASPPLPSYSHRTATSRPSSIYSELPSLPSHQTSTSRPSSHYGTPTTERPSSFYSSGISTTERPSSRHSSVASATERPSSLYGSVGASTERPSYLYGSVTSTSETPSSLYGSAGASSTARPSSLYGDTPTPQRVSSSTSQNTTSLSHSSLHEPSSYGSTSTYRPYSSSSSSYSPSLGRSTMHESTGMHHSLPPSSSFDGASASKLDYTSYSTASFGDRNSSSGKTAPLEYSSTRHDYSSSPTSSFSHRFVSSASGQSGSSATDFSSSLTEGTYTQQILAGQTRLHVPGFEEEAFKVPNKDHIEESIDSGDVRFSRGSDAERRR